MTKFNSIIEIIKGWKEECKVTHRILFRYSGGVLTVCTDKPGQLIGVCGQQIYKYEKILKEFDKRFVRIQLVETNGIV